MDPCVRMQDFPGAASVEEVLEFIYGQTDAEGAAAQEAQDGQIDEHDRQRDPQLRRPEPRGSGGAMADGAPAETRGDARRVEFWRQGKTAAGASLQLIGWSRSYFGKRRQACH
jgi:hypothetical protein